MSKNNIVNPRVIQIDIHPTRVDINQRINEYYFKNGDEQLVHHLLESFEYLVPGVSKTLNKKKDLIRLIRENKHKEYFELIEKLAKIAQKEFNK